VVQFDDAGRGGRDVVDVHDHSLRLIVDHEHTLPCPMRGCQGDVETFLTGPVPHFPRIVKEFGEKKKVRSTPLPALTRPPPADMIMP